MNKMQDKQMIIYQAENGEIKVDVQIHDETVWLTQQQMAKLFNKNRTVITKHVNKVLIDEELDSTVCAIFAHTASDGKTYDTQYYNLDMIISVGYRVNSKRGIEFRRWASKILKDYLIQGYSVNRDKVTQDKLNQLKQTVELLSTTLINQNLINDTGKELVDLIKAYAKTWEMLVRYDEDSLSIPVNLKETESGLLNYQEAIEAISVFKNELKQEGREVGTFFGVERDNTFRGILGNIDQTFGGKALYRSSQEKAAHLLYFIIKDHPFSDGNKRIGSLLFLLYLNKAKIGLKDMGVSGITSLALLIAESNPKQKELMVMLIMNLISE